jgi:hypothetical protein
VLFTCLNPSIEWLSIITCDCVVGLSIVGYILIHFNIILLSMSRSASDLFASGFLIITSCVLTYLSRVLYVPSILS